MSFSINPAAWGKIFPVPAQIVDQHIRLASGEQLKVLLWILRHDPENPDINQLCTDLKYDPSDAEDYLQYWLLTGILQQQGQPHILPFVPTPAPVSPPPIVSPTETPPQAAPAPKRLPALPVSKPTSAQIAARAAEAAEIQFLFTEAQSKLGRTIGYEGQCSLLLMHDQYGLPVEVILMVLEYCVCVGKTNLNYIEAIARDWGEREIDSIEKADAEISALRQRSSLWQKFAAMAGISNPRPTAAQAAFLAQWIAWGFPAETIYLAYEEMANHTQRLSFPYINKVLQNWQQNRLLTPQAVAEAAKQKQSGKAATPAKNGKRAASYDIGEFKKRSLDVPEVYKKKES